MEFSPNQITTAFSVFLLPILFTDLIIRIRITINFLLSALVILNISSSGMLGYTT